MEEIFNTWTKLSHRSKILAVWSMVAAVAVIAVMLICSVSFVTVNDNGVITKYRTRETNVHMFLREEGIRINQGDVVDSNDRLTTFSKVNIIRSFDVFLSVAGESQRTRSIPASVGEILENNGIMFDADDALSHDPGEYITDNVQITLDYIDREVITEDIVIPSFTRYLSSTYALEDRSTQTQKGQDGLKKATYDITYVNGIEKERTLLDEQVVVEAVDRVVVVGTKQGSLASRGSAMRYTDVYEVTATAYTFTGNRTRTGTNPKIGTVAVDPKVIPLGSKLYIESIDGTSWCYGYATAEDTGGSIKGNRIDLFMLTYDECICFGARKARVYVLE